MKRHSIIIAAASLLLASCAAHYVATDSVTRQLDGSRSILTPDSDTALFKGWQEDSLATPLPFDFRSEKDTMRYSYTIDIINGGWSVQHDSMLRLLQPEVTVDKSFRWFTTRYSYTARFPQLDSLPVPISDYLTEDEQQLLFSHSELPADWNGNDLYGMLDNLNTKYVRWWSHCLFEREMAAYAAVCDSTQRALLDKYHDTLLVLTLAELPNEFKSASNVSTAFPELEFINRINSVGFEALQKSQDLWELNRWVLWRTELPGGKTAEHMVSADRMILGDYIIEEQSDIINWWAVVITIAVAICIIIIIAKKRW